jgi:tetratricopeptide (TPR) repeat protein
LVELGLAHLNANRLDAAVDCLRQATLLAPDNAAGHYNLALAFERLGKTGEAILELHRAIAIDADLVIVLERLGNLLARHDRRDAAMDCFRRIVSLQPDSLVGRLSNAKVLAEAGRHVDAATLLRETAIVFPQSGEVKQALAIVLREQGRFDEALPLLIEATRGSPAQAAAAYHDLIVSKTIVPADAPMLQQVRELLAHAALPEAYRPRLNLALGKALDDLGQYEDAMKHFDQGNCIVRHREPFDRGCFVANMQRLTAIFTADFLKDYPGLGSSSEAPILILGMPRSGTTLVEQIVTSHQHIAAGGELNFWNAKADIFTRVWHNRLTASRIAQIAGEYETTLLRIDPGAMRATDKSPNNFLWIGLIRIVFPRARIIHCRRHPVDTCLSNYFTSFRERMPFANSKADLALYYQHYARLMQHWRTILPPECLHEIDYEQLVAEPEFTTRRLIAFCELDWDGACLHPEANHRLVQTASLWQVRQPISRGSVDRWRNYEPWLEELSQLLKPASP